MPERFEDADTPSYAIQSAIQKYLFASEFTQGKIVLDIACGIGYGSDIIQNNSEKSIIVAADNFFKGIKFGKNTYNNKINFFNINAQTLPFRNYSYDIVVSFETFEHLKELKPFLEEIYRILKKDGILICSTPNRDWSQKVGIKNEFHLKEYTHNEMKDLLSENFNKIESFGQLETASEILFKLPILFKIYSVFRPILARIFSVKESKVVATTKINPKFKVKKFWKTSPYLIFIAKKI